MKYTLALIVTWGAFGGLTFAAAGALGLPTDMRLVGYTIAVTCIYAASEAAWERWA